MSDVAPLEPVLDNAHERLETAPTLVKLVRHVNVDPVLRTTEYERFEALEYDAIPMVRALFRREFAGLSWNSLYEFLSTD